MLVARWGGSLAVRLPRKLVEALGLKVGYERELAVATRSMLQVAKDGRRDQALAAIRARRWDLPAAYRFNRDEANAR